ncbi:hypothetical protein F2P56_006113, partial [Juglans regia]
TFMGIPQLLKVCDSLPDQTTPAVLATNPPAIFPAKSENCRFRLCLLLQTQFLTFFFFSCFTFLGSFVWSLRVFVFGFTCLSMGRWRKQQGGVHHKETQGTRSQNWKPPVDTWQSSVPPWEKKFCTLIGSVPWRKLLETKKCMYLYDNVVQWNDSAGAEAFHNAKFRFWAEINGLPCDISLPDPDMYIEEVDWNSDIDPELLLDLEQEPKAPFEEDEDEDEKAAVLGDSLLLNQSFPCTGWGEAEEDLREATDLARHPGYGDCNQVVDNNNNPWEHNYGQRNEAMEDNGWGSNQNDSWGWNQWKSKCNEWEKNYNESDNVKGERAGGYGGMWDDNSRRKEVSDRYMSRYKTSRFHGNDYQMGRGGKNGRGRRTINFAYE